MQLETDSTAAGPKGKLLVQVRNAGGQTIATADTSEIGMGGKPPGPAVKNNYSSSATIAPNIAQNAASLYVEAQCTGSVGALWGINLGDAAHAFQIIVTAIAAAGG